MRLFERRLSARAKVQIEEYVEALLRVSVRQALAAHRFNSARQNFHETGQSDLALVEFWDAADSQWMESGRVVSSCEEVSPPKVAVAYHRALLAAYAAWHEWAWACVEATAGGPDRCGVLFSRMNEKMAMAERRRIGFFRRSELSQEEIDARFDQALSDALREAGSS